MAYRVPVILAPTYGSIGISGTTYPRKIIPTYVTKHQLVAEK